MRVLVLGGSGFIGSALVKAFLARGYSVLVSTRGASRVGQVPAPGVGSLTWVHWDGRDGQSLMPFMHGVDVVVNLLGENIAARRWNKVQKARILNSRIGAGDAVTQAFLLCKAAGHVLPHTLIQASACGYYGSWADANYAPCCTEDAESGKGFLAETCIAWEASTNAVEPLGVRRCIVRTAPVLGAGGGMLAKMLPLFRFGLGGVSGSGLQPMSWVHIDDEVAAIVFLAEHDTLSGPFNLSAPHPVMQRDFVTSLAQMVHRPAWLHTPGWVLEWMLGQMAKELILTGQKVVPARLQAEGFIFSFPRLEGALGQILAEPARD